MARSRSRASRPLVPHRLPHPDRRTRRTQAVQWTSSVACRRDGRATRCCSRRRALRPPRRRLHVEHALTCGRPSTRSRPEPPRPAPRAVRRRGRRWRRDRLRLRRARGMPGRPANASPRRRPTSPARPATTAGTCSSSGGGRVLAPFTVLRHPTRWPSPSRPTSCGRPRRCCRDHRGGGVGAAGRRFWVTLLSVTRTTTSVPALALVGRTPPSPPSRPRRTVRSRLRGGRRRAILNDTVLEGSGPRGPTRVERSTPLWCGPESTGRCDDRTLTSLVDKADAWGLSNGGDSSCALSSNAYAQRTLVLLAPKEGCARSARRECGDCLNRSHTCSCWSPRSCARRCSARSSAEARRLPLAFAGVLTLISFLATSWQPVPRSVGPGPSSQAGSAPPG